MCCNRVDVYCRRKVWDKQDSKNFNRQQTIMSWLTLIDAVSQGGCSANLQSSEFFLSNWNTEETLTWENRLKWNQSDNNLLAWYNKATSNNMRNSVCCSAAEPLFPSSAPSGLIISGRKRENAAIQEPKPTANITQQHNKCHWKTSCCGASSSITNEWLCFHSGWCPPLEE